MASIQEFSQIFRDHIAREMCLKTSTFLSNLRFFLWGGAKTSEVVYIFLELQTSIYKWLLQLDDAKSLYRKCFFIKHLFINRLQIVVWASRLAYVWMIHPIQDEKSWFQVCDVKGKLPGKTSESSAGFREKVHGNYLQRLFSRWFLIHLQYPHFAIAIEKD